MGAIFTAPIISNAQVLTALELRVGVEGRFPIKEKADPYWPYDGYFVILDNGTSRGIHYGAGVLVNTVLWHNNWGLSVSPALRYAKVLEGVFFGVGEDQYGLTFDLNIEIQYKINSNDWFLKNSALGAGVSLANVGNHTKVNYFLYEYLNQPPVFEYHVDSFFRLGLSFYWEKHLSKRLITKFKIVYSDKKMMKDYIPTFLWDINGSFSIQYTIWNKSNRYP